MVLIGVVKYDRNPLSALNRPEKLVNSSKAAISVVQLFLDSFSYRVRQYTAHRIDNAITVSLRGGLSINLSYVMRLIRSCISSNHRSNSILQLLPAKVFQPIAPVHCDADSGQPMPLHRQPVLKAAHPHRSVPRILSP